MIDGKKKKLKEGEEERGEDQAEPLNPEVKQKRKRYPGLCIPDGPVEDPVMTKEEKDSAMVAMNEVREEEYNKIYCIPYAHILPYCAVYVHVHVLLKYYIFT